MTTPFDKGLRWGNVKQFSHSGRFKHIHAYSDIFRHNQSNSEIIQTMEIYLHVQTYPGIFRTLCHLDIYTTLVHSKPWHIQNQKHVQNTAIFRTLKYSELLYIQKQRHIQNPSIFRNLTYSEPGIFKTLVYLALWYVQNQKRIQNPSIFRTKGIFPVKQPRRSVYTNHYYFCNISFSRSVIYEKNTKFLNTGLIFTPEVFILYQEV